MTLRPRLRVSFRLVLAWALCLASATPAAAQDFVKVDDAAREQLPATPFIAVAYGFIWAAVFLYVWMVARGVARVRGELADLRSRLDRASSDSSAAR